MANRNLLLVVFSCILLGACSGSGSSEYEKVERLVETLINVVTKFATKFESKENLSELEDIITTIDTCMLEYQGLAKSNLDHMRNSYSCARLTYNNCVDPVFVWCISVISPINIFLTEFNKPNLPPSDADIIWSMTGKAVLDDGISTAAESLDTLSALKTKVSVLENSLKDMMANVTKDFGPGGYYKKREEEIREMAKKPETSIEGKLVRTITRFCKAIIAFLKKGTAGFREEFSKADLDDVVDQRRNATYEEELKTIATFFKVLDNKIGNAGRVSGQVTADLEADKVILESITGLQNKNVSSWLNPSQRVQLIPSFQILKNTCTEYTNLRTNGHKKHKGEQAP